MKMKIAVFLCVLFIALAGCKEATIEKEHFPTQNGPRADTVGSATVETVGKETKVTFVFKNQSDKTITVQGGANYTLQKDKQVVETGSVPVKDYIDLQPGQEYKDTKTFANLQLGSYRIEFVWNQATAAAEFIKTNSTAFDETNAAALVLKSHPDFPKPGEIKKIETTTGGPAPVTKVSGELITTVENFTHKDADVVSVDLDSYVVVLTKKWNITVNGKEAKSIWKYKVTNDGKVELISSEENADIIATIK